MLLGTGVGAAWGPRESPGPQLVFHAGRPALGLRRCHFPSLAHTLPVLNCVGLWGVGVVVVRGQVRQLLGTQPLCVVCSVPPQPHPKLSDPLVLPILEKERKPQV